MAIGDYKNWVYTHTHTHTHTGTHCKEYMMAIGDYKNWVHTHTHTGTHCKEYMMAIGDYKDWVQNKIDSRNTLRAEMQSLKIHMCGSGIEQVMENWTSVEFE